MKNRLIIDKTRQDKTRQDKTRQDKTRQDKQPYCRNSSLELLRIVAMLIILLHHFRIDGGFDLGKNFSFINELWLRFWGSTGNLGHLGDEIFVFISGYFLVKSQRVKWQKVFNLWLRVLFYSITFFVIFTFCGIDRPSTEKIVRSFFPILTRHWWFISCYFILYVLHPFLNTVLVELNKKSYRTFIILMFVLWSLVLLTNYDVEFDKIIDFICLYSIGGYIRLWNDKAGKKYILWGIAFAIAGFLVLFMLEITGTGFISVGDKKIYLVQYIHGMMGIFDVFAALFMLMGFSSLNVPYSKLINTIASATLGVYLIHGNIFMGKFLWNNIFHNASFQDSPYLIPYSICVVILVYVVCTLIELLRSKIFRILSRGYLS